MVSKFGIEEKVNKIQRFGKVALWGQLGVHEAPSHGSLADEARTLVTYRADKILFAKKYSEDEMITRESRNILRILNFKTPPSQQH